MTSKLTVLIFLVSQLSCMQLPSINLKSKKFNQYPSKIVWIQLAGFDEEQLFHVNLKEGDVKKYPIDAFTCVGMHWEFNSNTLSPDSHLVMRSLLTGKSNINGTCDDFYHAPLWSYIASEGMRSVVVEKSATSSESLLRSSECKEAHKSWEPSFFIQLDGNNGNQNMAKPFSILERGKLKNPGKYYDSSCTGSECYNDLLTTLSYVTDEVLRYEKNFTFIVRDFSAEKYLAKKDFVKWSKWINEWNQVIAYLQNSLSSNETLLLVTGVAPIPMQYPRPGSDLKKWITQYSGAQVRQRSYLGKTWAMGARSENFCGMYKADDYLQRIFWQNTDRSILGF